MDINMHKQKVFIKGQMLMIDKHKFEQNYNIFGYLSTKFWLKGNDKTYCLNYNLTQ